MTETFRHDEPPRAGVLVINLGTPEAPTPDAVRRYLAEFLSDRRVIDVNPLLWTVILHGVILRVRPPKVAKAYASIWTEGGSPLLALSSALAEGIGTGLGSGFEVELAMCYGNPSIPAALERLQAKRVRRLVVLPLYPQYSATTTAAAFDGLAKALTDCNWLPELRVVNHYHDDPVYIRALAERVEAHWAEHGRPDRLVMSFHGIPQRYHLAGDPYPCECRKTARLLAACLGLGDDDYEVTFQSRFGREPWLQPYTDHRLEELGEDGVEHVQVICPGFAVDCLETLEEIDEENRELFLESGGQRFSYIPALNDGPEHVALLTEVVRRHCAGWPELAAGYAPEDMARAADESAARAREAGAPA